MQTGSIPLAGYLDTFKTMEWTECPCGRGLQDTRHGLLHCTNQAGSWIRHLTQGSGIYKYDFPSFCSRSPMFVVACPTFWLQMVSGPLRCQPISLKGTKYAHSLVLAVCGSGWYVGFVYSICVQSLGGALLAGIREMLDLTSTVAGT